METKDLIVAELEKVKSALETSLTEKNKEEIAGQLKDHLALVDQKLTEAKNLKEGAEAQVVTDLKKEMEDLRVEYKALIKDFDRMQIRVKSTKVTAPETKSFNEAIAEAIVEKTDEVAKFARKETKSLIIDLKAVADVSTANVTGGSRYGQLFQSGIIQTPARKTHIRSLLPGGSIGPGNTFTFMRENGAGEGAIAPTAEGATKPQIDVDLVEATVNVETIAGWLRISRKALANIPGMTSFLQARLPEKMLRVEDDLLLNGDGATPNIKGIIQSGNYTAATSAATTLVEALMDSIAQLEELDRAANGILVTPTNWMSLFKNKATGSGEFDLPYNVVFVGGTLFLAGVPVYASTAMGATQYIVGDWAMGAQLLTQEGMRLEFFEQDGTNVRENKITVRIEENVAFPVYGSDYFIVGSIPS